jgi:phosphoserine phosphatase RsbU/P
MSGQPLHVLLIEDNQGDADLVRLRLVEAYSDMRVSCVDRLSTGLASMSETPPALVLLDLNLPDSKGADTFRTVLQRARGVPVVVLSGRDDEQLAIKAVHQGAQDFLVKGSFDSKQLARTMQYAIERQALLTSLDMTRKQQLQFKDQFLSHVSHELRTPLTCIHQFVTILLDELAGPIPPEQREHLDTVLRSVNQLRTMIGDLLEATRAESSKLRVKLRCTVLGNVISQAAAMMRANAQTKQVGLEVAVDGRIPLILADPDRLLQVLLNLLDNAIKFTPPDGSVMIRAYLVEAEPNFAYISVTDTGRGIPTESKALIFERLYQDPHAVDNSRKGLGLGLYIVRELVRLHGGQVWVDSQPGEGSTFSLTVPLFSLAKILAPIVAEQGRLRDALTLVKVELTPESATASGDSPEASERLRELLQTCILPANDLLLPDLGPDGPNKLFAIVASAAVDGAEVLSKRIREKLGNCAELEAGTVLKVSVEAIPLPAQQANRPLDGQVQEIADRITEMVLAATGLTHTDPPLRQASTMPANVNPGEMN